MGFSSWGPQALEHRLKVVAQGLGPSWHVGSSEVQDPTRVSCINRCILYHWATREAQEFLILMFSNDQGFFFFPPYG